MRQQLAQVIFFHVCSPIVGGVNVPNSGFGYQTAFDGNGMLGIMLVLDSGEASYFEYVQARLLSRLKSGYSYQFSFYVNLANGSDFAIEKIGTWFTEEAVTSNKGTSLFSIEPQVKNTTGFITDTIGWIKIEGSFIANGGEEYITIGYYTDTLNIDTIRNNPIADPTTIFVYYYIDGFKLREVEQTVVIPNVITPNNGDGINDVFELNFPFTNVIIYNRWGKMVFFSEGEGKYWDGTIKGKPAPSGAYYYVVTTDKDTYKGFVQVIR